MDWNINQVICRKYPTDIAQTLSMPPSTAKINPATSAHCLAFPHTGCKEHLSGQKSLQYQGHIPVIVAGQCTGLKGDLKMVDHVLGSCCCQFFSSGTDRGRNGVITVAVVMGKGVIQEVDTSWNHTHLYTPSLNHHCYLHYSCSHRLGGICNGCRLNFPTPSCYGLCGQWCL